MPSAATATPSGKNRAPGITIALGLFPAAGTAVAGTAVAGTAVAGTAVAGTAVAGIAVAGTDVAGITATGVGFTPQDARATTAIVKKLNFKKSLRKVF